MTTFGVKSVDGFDKTLILYRDGYMARPVTLDKNTISGLTPNDKGRYIIPQGTYLTGVHGSLLQDPQQMAIQATIAEARATATINSSVVINAKESGEAVYKFSLVKATESVPVEPDDLAMHGTISYDVATKKFTIILQVDKNGNVISTYGDVVAIINNDIVANTYVTASLANGVSGVTKAAVTATDVSTTVATGATETVTGIIDGVLYHSVDVTDGEAVGTLMWAGSINMDNMPSVPSTAVKAALPRILFSRVD